MIKILPQNMLVAFIFIILFSQDLICKSTLSGAEFQISTYTQWGRMWPSLCTLNNGNFVVCWTKRLNSRDDELIVGQILNSECEKIGAEFQISRNIYKYQSSPVVASFNSSGFVVCWQSHDLDNAQYYINCQLFDSSGDYKGNEVVANTSPDREQVAPAVAVLKDDHFVICWESQNQDDEKSGICGQIFDSDGLKIGTEFQIDTTISSGIQPSVCALKDSEFVVCWTEHHVNNEHNIICQKFDNPGSKIGFKFKVNTSDGNISNSSVCETLNDGFFVCWWGVYGQLFNSLGDKIGSELKVSTDGFGRPKCKLLSNGNLVICYETMDEHYEGVACQILSKNGIKVGDEFQVNQTTQYEQWWPSIATYNDGGFIIIWQSHHPDFGYGLFGRCFNFSDVGITDDLNIQNNQYALYQNSPNPFNSSTTIEYTINASQYVSIKIYNIIGDLITTLVNDFKSPGNHKVLWDGKDEVNKIFPSGIYICVMNIGSISETKKMLLLR